MDVTLIKGIVTPLDLSQHSLQVQTSSPHPTHKTNIWYVAPGTTWVGGILLEFTSGRTTYTVRYCMSGPEMFEEYNPPGEPKAWTFVRGETEFQIYCNDVMMLRYVYPEFCRSYYKQAAVGLYFLVDDTASKQYRLTGQFVQLYFQIL